MTTPSPTPTPTPQQQDSKTLDQAKRGAKDAVLGRKTLVLPLQLFYVSGFVLFPDVARAGVPPSMIPLWSLAEIKQVLAITDMVLQRTMGVALDCPQQYKIEISTVADVSIVNFVLAAGRDGVRLHHKTFDGLIKRAVSAAPSTGNIQPTLALLVNKIYESGVEPAASQTRGFALPAASDDPDEPSNRVVVGYIQDSKRGRPPDATRFTDWVPSFQADIEIAGVVLAHEIGHSLALEHNEDLVAGKKNLMTAVVDKPPRGKAAPATGADFNLSPDDAKDARAFGQETKRFRAE